jgi:membrane protease YdiL (CAAX protease family)
VLLTACANAVAEELFFRGALWSLVQDSACDEDWYRILSVAVA